MPDTTNVVSYIFCMYVCVCPTSNLLAVLPSCSHRYAFCSVCILAVSGWNAVGHKLALNCKPCATTTNPKLYAMT